MSTGTKMPAWLSGEECKMLVATAVAALILLGGTNTHIFAINVAEVWGNTIYLQDVDSGLTWPTGNYRWRDVADQLYSEDYITGTLRYNYTQATVQVTYDPAASTLNGTLIATNLKPNFAYQLKLVGFPGTLSNERIGLVGRWWQEEWNGSEWTNGHNLNDKGGGYSPNPNDVIYLATRNITDTSLTGLHYRYTGYLVFDYFITDEEGNAVLSFDQDSSYHVLWKPPPAPATNTQWNRTDADGPLRSSTFDADLSAAYDNTGEDDYPSQTVGVFGEWERLPVGGTSLPPGDYTARIVLTEESFHGSGGALAGTWAAAMDAGISFDIVSETGFITVEGTRFALDGEPYHYVGTNNYYLGIDPARTQEEVDEVLDDAGALGLSIIRIWGFNDGPGGLRTDPGVYDEAVFQRLDYAIAKAGELDIRLIIPFVNNWDEYGGMRQYVDWSPTTDKIHQNAPQYSGEWKQYHDQFYFDENTKAYYRDHVQTLLNRTNTYTGVKYKYDPTIMAWELANEPRAETISYGPDWTEFRDWIHEMTDYVKTLDDKHLLTVGLEGHPWEDTDRWKAYHDRASIDFTTVHSWPDHWAPWWNGGTRDKASYMNLITEHALASQELGKPMILEEFGKYRTSDFGDRDEWYAEYYQTVANNSHVIGGSNFWILYHDTYPDYDGFGVYYPADASTIEVIRNTYECILFSDVDGDGDVDVADVMLVASIWRCQSGDPCYNANYDLDEDGDIDIVDIMLVAVHWGKTCPLGF